MHIEGCSEDYLYLFLFFILDTFILVHGPYDHYWHTLYLSFLYMLMFVSFTYPCMCCFFSFFIHMLLTTCMQSIISVSHKDALMSFV